jgi:hypothetical protein
MKDRHERQNKSRAARAARAAAPYVWLDQVLLAATAGLLVATPLIPSEATVHQGTGAPLNLLWLLVLFAWAAGQVLRPDPRVKFGWTGVAAAALIGWHTLSALTAGMHGNGRQALNVLWQFVSYATAAFLLRQLLHTPLQCRALVVVVVALASVEATHGYYEYFISKPADLAQFERNPEIYYQQAGADTPAERQQFRWRVESVEPLGTFGLTNSLAGLLAPWLVAVLGIGLSLAPRRDRWLPLAGATLVAVLLAVCLLLTKSRTGILATGVGIVLLLLYGRTGGWRLNWKIPAVGAAVLVMLGLGAVAIGGLDIQVLSQAPISVQYRLQYWQATARMIANHPLVGVGPGQFQQSYARYKLPEASETIADPHNFLLEIWSTAGTPALLALLVMAGCFAWQLGRRPTEAADDPWPEPPSSRFLLYVGGIAGLLAAFPLGLVVGYPPSVVGFPAALVTLWLLDGWVVAGRMPVALPVIALVVLLVNLLAAGATSFPGVFLTAWLLVPVAMAQADAPSWNWHPPRGQALMVLAATLVLLVLCARTQVTPVLGAASHLAQAEQLARIGRAEPAEELLKTAAQLDPWSPRPWQSLAELRLQRWIQTGRAADWEAFTAATLEYHQRDPRNHAQFTAQGNWLLLAWRNTGDPRLLDNAIEAYRRAVAWYPNRAIVHAQLAWALHLAGDAEAAAKEADLALILDARHAHREQKLSEHTIYDPQKPSGQPPETAPRPPVSAEQIVRRLRSGKGTENSP